MNLLKNKLFFGSTIAFLLSILFGLSSLSGIFRTLEVRVADFLYKPSATSSDIIIVAVDNNSIDSAYGLGYQACWSRDVYARVIENISKYGPKVIGVDFYLKNPRDVSGDENLADILKKNPIPVVLGFMVEWRKFSREQGSVISDNISNYLPLEQFRNNERITSAFINFYTEKDNVVRSLAPEIQDRTTGMSFNAFSKEIADIFSGNDSSVPTVNGVSNINFFSSPGSPDTETKFRQVSFVETYNDQYQSFNPETFKDKIVLIGATANALQDVVATPVSYNYKMPGVEVHANAIQTILEKKFLRYMYPWEQILLIVLISFASVFVFMYTRIRWSLLYLIGVGGGYAFLAPFLFDHGVIVDLVRPYMALALAFISIYVYRYVTEFRQKTELKNAFSKYVNPAIVNRITAHPEMLKLGGEKRAVTVIFTDIKGFTTVSEGLKPESLVALLNEYLEKMSDVIFNEGGTVDKYEGDAILAFFGAPVPQEDHAERACRTVLKMRRALTELNAKWATDPPLPGGEKKPQIEFRAGISAGDVIVGNIGSSKKLNYTVIGDNVNLGSRLEGVNKKYGTDILMSQDTFGLVKDLFITREVDIIRVVGKQHPVRVYELLAEKALSDGADLTLLKLYEEGIGLYKERKFAEGLAKFEDILKSFPDDGPSRLYRQRCEVLRDFPPKADWDGVYEMGEK